MRLRADPTYNTHGVAIQLSADDPAPFCDPTDKKCTDYDFNVPACCTAECNVLVRASGTPCFDTSYAVLPLQGLDYFRVTPVVPGNATGGVQLFFPGPPPG